MNAHSVGAAEKQFLIPNCGPFSEGLAPVWDENQKIGYVDRAGKLVLSPRYDSASPFDGGLARVSIDG